MAFVLWRCTLCYLLYNRSSLWNVAVSGNSLDHLVMAFVLWRCTLCYYIYRSSLWNVAELPSDSLIMLHSTVHSCRISRCIAGNKSTLIIGLIDRCQCDPHFPKRRGLPRVVWFPFLGFHAQLNQLLPHSIPPLCVGPNKTHCIFFQDLWSCCKQSY